MYLLMRMETDLDTAVNTDGDRTNCSVHHLCLSLTQTASVFNFNPVSDPPGGVNDVHLLLCRYEICCLMFYHICRLSGQLLSGLLIPSLLRLLRGSSLNVLLPMAPFKMQAFPMPPSTTSIRESNAVDLAIHRNLLLHFEYIA